MQRRGMLRIERGSGAIVLVSRLARPHVLALLGGALAAAAVLVARTSPRAAAALALAAALVALLGGRSVRARFERGRVEVRPAVPFQPRAARPLSEFTGARVETVAEARRRRAEQIARGWRDRSGMDMPSWLRRSEAPGTNDQLRRIVLVPRAGDPLAVTAWLAEDDLEKARETVEGLLG